MYRLTQNCAAKHNQCYQQLSDELNKTDVLLIATTMLVVKTENIYQDTSKAHIAMKT